MQPEKKVPHLWKIRFHYWYELNYALVNIYTFMMITIWVFSQLLKAIENLIKNNIEYLAYIKI